MVVGNPEVEAGGGAAKAMAVYRRPRCNQT